jgi:hypothetical protein
MAELKTKETDESVDKFLTGLDDEQKIKDSLVLRELMEDITGAPAKMWGSSIIGFDTYHYKYKSGREGDWPLAAFSPRKQTLTIYMLPGFDGDTEAGDYNPAPLLEKLGEYTTSKGCLYVKRLSDIDQAVLRKLIEMSVKHVKSGKFQF